MLNFNYVESYKYLGTVVDGTLNLKEHLQMISKKAMFVYFRLTPFRKVRDMKFNSNAFTIYIKPYFKLLHTVYHNSKTAQKRKVEIMYNKLWKMYCSLPRSTPNRILHAIIG